jgi:hypothetical protein
LAALFGGVGRALGLGGTFVRAGLLGECDLAAADLVDDTATERGCDLLAVELAAVDDAVEVTAVDVGAAVGVLVAAGGCDELVHAPRRATEKTAATARTTSARIP